MTYEETVDYLYSQTPQFQQIGAAAYKPGLDTVKALAGEFGNPQNSLRAIHVGGTNGKGSTSHTLAAILQSSGYKVGLFTSPHLTDFRERIRINGEKIPRQAVIDFVERFLEKNKELKIEPSFFELTTVMAFQWFAENNVDFAVIEVGLGGRLDSTNIITPILSVVTNISFDHTAQLGNTLPLIASEKAGIFKPGVPAVIGEAEGEVKETFVLHARETSTPLRFAQESANRPHKIHADSPSAFSKSGEVYSTEFGEVTYGLTGDCQQFNFATICTALSELRKQGIEISDDAIKTGASDVCALTGLMGRWMTVAENPLTICDTGHNVGGWSYLGPRLGSYPGELMMVIGFVNDKDVSHILEMMPKKARYFFTRASVPRALPAETLAEQARRAGLLGEVYQSMAEAHSAARECASEASGNPDCEPMIFVGGSTFIVADLLRETLPDA